MLGAAENASKSDRASDAQQLYASMRRKLRADNGLPVDADAVVFCNFNKLDKLDLLGTLFVDFI